MKWAPARPFWFAVCSILCHFTKLPLLTYTILFLRFRSFLEQVLTDLGLSAPSRSKTEAFARLNDYLMARSREDLTTALVVDESQLLGWELYEEIRLLTNLETAHHKLLQIVLAGQPELDQ